MIDIYMSVPDLPRVSHVPGINEGLRPELSMSGPTVPARVFSSVRLHRHARGHSTRENTVRRYTKLTTRA
jgi:hypothetical protein